MDHVFPLAPPKSRKTLLAWYIGQVRVWWWLICLPILLWVGSIYVLPQADTAPENQWLEDVIYS